MKLEHTLHQLKQQSKKILSLFVTAGYPALESTVPLIQGCHGPSPTYGWRAHRDRTPVSVMEWSMTARLFFIAMCAKVMA